MSTENHTPAAQADRREELTSFLREAADRVENAESLVSCETHRGIGTTTVGRVTDDFGTAWRNVAPDGTRTFKLEFKIREFNTVELVPYHQMPADRIARDLPRALERAREAVIENMKVPSELLTAKPKKQDKNEQTL